MLQPIEIARRVKHPEDRKSGVIADTIAPRALNYGDYLWLHGDRLKQRTYLLFRSGWRWRLNVRDAYVSLHRNKPLRVVLSQSSK